MPNAKPAALTQDTAPVDPTLVFFAQNAAGTADYKVALIDLPVSTATQTAINDVAAVGIVVREYSGSAWEARGTLPAGTTVLWVNRYDDTEPASGGSGYVVGTDIILLNVA
jgi:hypothetical protein